MSDTVTVKVLREHSGDSGHHPEKSSYSTALLHARQLRSQGLVEFDDPDEKAEQRSADKAESAPANKSEAKSRNKGSQK